MQYSTRFDFADDLMHHMDTFVPGLPDLFIQSRYAGFLTIAGITVYELAIKDIFYAFSDQKHPVLGNAARNKFGKINGQIRLEDLKNRHVAFFGEKYKDKFNKKLALKKERYFKAHKVDIINSYSNLIVWRHSLIHSAETVPATYEEVKSAYIHGKEVIHCLNECMYR